MTDEASILSAMESAPPSVSGGGRDRRTTAALTEAEAKRIADLGREYGVTTAAVRRIAAEVGRSMPIVYRELNAAGLREPLARRSAKSRKLSLTTVAPSDAVCEGCADLHGGLVRNGHQPTWWRGDCAVCGEHGAVCAASDRAWRKGYPPRLRESDHV